MEYTKNEIINEINKIDKLENIYTSKIINYKGKTKDTKEKYTEVISKEILENPEKYNFNNIKIIKREKGYNTKTHDGKYNASSTRREEIIAMKLYNSVHQTLGKILDYQIPLKDKKNTKAGKIDLISFSKQDKTLYLIELKNDRSKETLLRCVLEIMTYINQIDKERLKKDYNLNFDTKIQPAILIFENTRPHKDTSDEYVTKLIEKFKITIFIANIDERFTIKKK